jgi:hypothetical protein
LLKVGSMTKHRKLGSVAIVLGALASSAFGDGPEHDDAYYARESLRELQGTWRYADMTVSIHGDRGTISYRRQTATGKPVVASPCAIELQVNGIGAVQAYTPGPDGFHFDRVDGYRSGKHWVVCAGSTMFVGVGASCHTLTREDQRWQPDGDTCPVTQHDDGSFSVLYGKDTVHLVPDGDALIPEGAPHAAKRI